MIFATDVYYQNDHAIAAGVLFSDWAAQTPEREVVVQLDQIADYEPGQFYKRELPCLLALLNQLQELPTYIIVDGFVYLDAAGKPGLGKHLYDALQGHAIVIGVAKTQFKDTPSSELLRGTSQNPLYITACGMNEGDAKDCIARMHGDHRIPTLLKRVDRLGRQSKNP